jgi:D-Tyr-tRNAtyr deacylase
MSLNTEVAESPMLIKPTPTLTSLTRRGRKPKYNNDFERKEAKRIQNKAYRERKKEELIELRRKAAHLSLVDTLVNAIDHVVEPSAEGRHPLSAE